MIRYQLHYFKETQCSLRRHSFDDAVFRKSIPCLCLREFCSLVFNTGWKTIPSLLKFSDFEQ